MKFSELRKYISKIDRVSICMKDTLNYQNYQFINEVPDSYNDYYVYGIGRIQSEFPIREALDEAVKMQIKISEDVMEEIIYADCIEIMLSDEPRKFE